jgi:hypothetical protein
MNKETELIFESLIWLMSNPILNNQSSNHERDRIVEKINKLIGGDLK